ncbi:MAG: hypothetical protein MRZ79_18630 [Bacteroidia bacterium]|nr:hypothetical protein [Bacteroidia bacterium]
MEEMTRIYLGGVLIEEPVTCLTDVMAGLTGLISFVVLSRLSPNTRENRWLSAYFFFLGVGLICAGFFGHAFFYALDHNWNWKTIGWSGSAIGIFCMERGSIYGLRKHLPKAWVDFLLALNILKLALFFFMVRNPDASTFDYVKINSALGLGVIVLISQSFMYLRDRVNGRRRVIGGILFGVLTALLYNNKIGLHKWFNYHDVSHIMTMISIFIMFLGVRGIIKETNQSSPQPST